MWGLGRARGSSLRSGVPVLVGTRAKMPARTSLGIPLKALRCIALVGIQVLARLVLEQKMCQMAKVPPRPSLASVSHFHPQSFSFRDGLIDGLQESSPLAVLVPTPRWARPDHTPVIKFDLGTLCAWINCSPSRGRCMWLPRRTSYSGQAGRPPARPCRATPCNGLHSQGAMCQCVAFAFACDRDAVAPHSVMAGLSRMLTKRVRRLGSISVAACLSPQAFCASAGMATDSRVWCVRPVMCQAGRSLQIDRTPHLRG